MKAAEAAKNICTVYEDNAIGESTARKRFSRFKEGRFDISDTPRPVKPSGFDEDCLNTLIRNDSRQCTRELVNEMNCDHCTIACLRIVRFERRSEEFSATFRVQTGSGTYSGSYKMSNGAFMGYRR